MSWIKVGSLSCHLVRKDVVGSTMLSLPFDFNWGHASAACRLSLSLVLAGSSGNTHPWLFGFWKKFFSYHRQIFFSTNDVRWGRFGT